MAHRRKRTIPVVAQKMSEEVRRVSLLAQALHDMRVALLRLSKEIAVCLAILICFWQALAELFARLLRLWWP